MATHCAFYCAQIRVFVHFIVRKNMLFVCISLCTKSVFCALYCAQKRVFVHCIVHKGVLLCTLLCTKAYVLCSSLCTKASLCAHHYAQRRGGPLAGKLFMVLISWGLFLVVAGGPS